MARKTARRVLTAYLLLLVILMFFEERLIYIPSRYPEGDWQSPGLKPEDAWFTAADGTRLHGWYAPSPRPRAVVLFCHGNAGNITDRIDLFYGMRDLVGVSVLVFDYRGFGRSEGRPTEAGVLADARAARQWLAQREGIPEEQIVLMGESLGGAVAVDLAAEKPARALILECTFARIRDVGAYHFPWLPVRWLMRTNFNSVEKIGLHQGPLLQLHGDSDTIVPHRFGQELFKAANEPKQFHTISGRDHNDARDLEYYEKIRAFLQQSA